MTVKSLAKESSTVLATPWVVAHSGARDQYQLPLALHETKQLHKFVTDVYSPLDHPFLGAALRHAPFRLRTIASQRYSEKVPSALVKDFKLRRALKLALHTDPLGLEMNRRIGEGAARAALRGKAHLLITSYYGWAAFPILPEETAKVLFQVHPQPWFLNNLYLGFSENDFRDELEVKVPGDFLKLWGQESLDADLVIAASEFTRKSLLYSGVQPDRIIVLPYGVDSSVFRNDVDFPSGKAKILFVGQPVARKGFNHLLRSWELIGSQSAELHIVASRPAHSPEDTRGASIIWHERLPLKDLVALMNMADLLVLPSIAEGFGHVLLQALSCGTPILASDATAAPDLLANWEDGFIFPSSDWAELGSRLDYWLANVSRLRSLRTAARAVAEGLSWEDFREGVRQACCTAVKSEQLVWS